MSQIYSEIYSALSNYYETATFQATRSSPFTGHDAETKASLNEPIRFISTFDYRGKLIYAVSYAPRKYARCSFLVYGAQSERNYNRRVEQLNCDPGTNSSTGYSSSKGYVNLKKSDGKQKQQQSWLLRFEIYDWTWRIYVSCREVRYWKFKNSNVRNEFVI